jgi:hypothetical protein
MIKTLLIPKKFNTYADTFLLLGLAQIAEDALRRTKQKIQMQLLDHKAHYLIQFPKPINLETISQLTYTNPFPPVRGQKTDWNSIPQETTFFDVVKQSEKRKLYREYQYQTGGKTEWNEEAPTPPDPRTQNGSILVSMRHDRNHNSLWLESWQLKAYYGVLVASLLEAFTQETQVQSAADLFQQKTGSQLPDLASAVKIYLPTAVQGVNRIKADGNKTDTHKVDWLSLWLIANGLFEFALSERIKIAEGVYDWRVTALEPQDITLDTYRKTLNDLRQFNPPGGGHGIARFDAELVLKFCQRLLENHQAKAKDNPEHPFDFWRKPVNDFVCGFRGTHFGSKGQVYGVKELFSLGLPGWICPDNSSELIEYLEVLKEHLSVITSLSAEDSHSELLAAYRDFITGTNLQGFFRFQVNYGDYVVKRLADPQARPPRLFSTFGLNIMMKKDKDLTKITKDPSFLRIAKAINQATVYAGKVKTKTGVKELEWQRNYGLAQQLSSQSGSKKDFVCAIADFLAKYEHENLRITDKLLGTEKTLRRVWPHKEDLDRLIELIEEFDHVLVANLLIAYGYANWSKAKDDLSKTSVDANIAPEISEDSEEDE